MCVGTIHMGRSPRGGHGNPLQYSCLGNPMNRRAWHATVHGVTELGTTEVTYTHAASLTCVFLLRSLYLSV